MFFAVSSIRMVSLLNKGGITRVVVIDITVIILVVAKHGGN